MLGTFFLTCLTFTGSQASIDFAPFPLSLKKVFLKHLMISFINRIQNPLIYLASTTVAGLCNKISGNQIERDIWLEKQ